MVDGLSPPPPKIDLGSNTLLMMKIDTGFSSSMVPTTGAETTPVYMVNTPPTLVMFTVNWPAPPLLGSDVATVGAAGFLNSLRVPSA